MCPRAPRPPALLALARRFLRDEGGSIAVESMLIMPALFWCYMGVFVFFDAFRAESINVKAAYTIGDVLSRETGFITPEYMDSLYSLQGVLTATTQTRRMRVTVINFQELNDRYAVRWSRTRGGATELTTASLAALRSRIPEMDDGEIAVVTETWMNYAPAFDVGIDPFTFQDLVVTRPRFASQLCWNSLNDGGGPGTAIC